MEATNSRCRKTLLILLGIIIVLTMLFLLLDIPSVLAQRAGRRQMADLNARSAFLRRIQLIVGQASSDVSLMDMQQRVDNLVVADGNPFGRQYVVLRVRDHLYIAEIARQQGERICIAPVGEEYTFFAESVEDLSSQIKKRYPSLSGS